MAGNLIKKPRDIPSIEELLQAPALSKLPKSVPRPVVADVAREAVDSFKQQLKEGQEVGSLDSLIKEIKGGVDRIAANQIARLINATGIAVHTNLGRAPIAIELFDRIKSTVTGYGNVEFDVTTGKRGHRGEVCEQYLAKLSGAESGTVANNCAAALFVSLSSIAKGKKVIISRGELVQIGGGFRIPDILRASGAKLTEIGTTNITTLADYEAAIDDRTALILKVHKSNFTQAGFTEEPSLKEIVNLGHQKDIPVLNDLGSGVFIPTDQLLGYHEPTVQESVRTGADLTCFSGDKLLGGLQAGLIVGKSELILRIKKNPIFRTVRVDKIVFSALESLLSSYLSATHDQDIPIWRTLTLETSEIKKRAESIQKQLKLKDAVTIEKTESFVGGGALPEQPIESIGLVFDSRYKARTLLNKFRAGTPPIIGRIENDRFILDLRTVDPDDFSHLVKAINSIVK